jgi:membrane protein DedA with SNARE-associated domain
VTVLAAIISVTSKLGYLLPALVAVESIGIPSPGETALILAAGLAAAGKLDIWLVIVIAIAAAIVGDNIGYAIGRKLGREILEAPGPLQARRVQLLAVGDHFFDRWGSRAVFLGRWVSIVRPGSTRCPSPASSSGTRWAGSPGRRRSRSSSTTAARLRRR